MAWNSGTRIFTSIIARAGLMDEKTGYREFCIIDYIDSPAVVSDEIFYISKKDQETYLHGRSPPGSALTFVGSLEIGEDKLLVINELKLCYCHEASFLNYHSSATCLYNIRSFCERAKALKKYDDDKLLKEQLEDERKQEAVKAARKRLDDVQEKKLKTLECEKIINVGLTHLKYKIKLNRHYD